MTERGDGDQGYGEDGADSFHALGGAVSIMDFDPAADALFIGVADPATETFTQALTEGGLVVTTGSGIQVMLAGLTEELAEDDIVITALGV